MSASDYYTDEVYDSIVPLKPEFKSMWLHALRSGTIHQAKGRLAQVQYDESINYCCLGVACEIQRQIDPTAGSWQVSQSNVVHIRWVDSDDSPNFYALSDKMYETMFGVEMPDDTDHDGGGLASVFLPFRVRPDSPSSYTQDGPVATLAMANDAGCTFAQIADLIEYFL